MENTKIINASSAVLILLLKKGTKIFCCLMIFLTSSCILLNIISVQSFAQGAEPILLPFRYDKVWDTVVKNGRDDYGVHQDKIGVGIDFYSDDNGEVLAPVSGRLSLGCIANGVTSVGLVDGVGRQFRLIHLVASTLVKTSGYVKQGDVIGYTAPKGKYGENGCNVTSDDKHVHFSIGTSNPTTCSWNIDGYIFDCSGMRTCTKTIDGKAFLTYEVMCNRKYLNQSFVSTNGFPLSQAQCDSLIRESHKSNSSTNPLNLQVCLTKRNFYFGVYSRIFDTYTKNQLNKYIDSISLKPVPVSIPTPKAEEPTTPKIPPQTLPDKIVNPEIVTGDSSEKVLGKIEEKDIPNIPKEASKNFTYLGVGLIAILAMSILGLITWLLSKKYVSK